MVEVVCCDGRVEKQDWPRGTAMHAMGAGGKKKRRWVWRQGKKEEKKKLWSSNHHEKKGVSK